MFEDTPEIKTPYEFDASSLFLTAAAEDFRRHAVLSVLRESPAAAARVEAGDVILEVDGRAAGELTLDQVRSALREHGALRVLKLRRGAKDVTARVALKRPV